MKQIKIGTCVPGPVAEEWLKGFVGKGFETFSLNFHMSLEGTDLDKLALTTDKLLAGTDSKITTLGYYCNPIQYAEHRKTPHTKSSEKCSVNWQTLQKKKV